MAKDAGVFIRLKDGNLVCLIPNVSEQVAKVCREALAKELPQDVGDYVTTLHGKVMETEAKRPPPREAAKAAERTESAKPQTPSIPSTKRFKPKKKGR